MKIRYCTNLWGATVDATPTDHIKRRYLAFYESGIGRDRSPHDVEQAVVYARPI